MPSRRTLTVTATTTAIAKSAAHATNPHIQVLQTRNMANTVRRQSSRGSAAATGTIDGDKRRNESGRTDAENVAPSMNAVGEIISGKTGNGKRKRAAAVVAETKILESSRKSTRVSTWENSILSFFGVD